MKQHNLFISFMGLDRVYVRKYGVAFLLDPLLAIATTYFLIKAVSSGIAEGKYITIFLCVLLGMYYVVELIKTLYIMRIIQNRNYSLINHLKQSRILASAINTELNFIDDAKLINFDKQSALHDLTFNFNRKTKNGEYLAKQAFYTVYETKLQRTLPHLIFDSKSAKGSQFKTVFLQAQRLSMDVNFDDYFDVYSPKTYQIDTLSFITPEVLQAMLELKEYDFEIVDNSLLVFAPLLRNAQLAEFEQQCLGVHEVLNDNLDTYHDDRLTGELRKNDVTNFSKRLLESPRRFIAPAILSGIISIGSVYAFLAHVQSSYLLFPPIIFLGYVQKIVKIVKKNSEIEQDFKSEMTLIANIRKDGKQQS